MSHRPSLAQSAARFGYSLLLTLLLPLIFLFLWKKLDKHPGSHKATWTQRLGWVPRPPATSGILFHCVSVGEVVTAAPVIHRLLSDNSDCTITITTTTTTGSARVKSLFGDKVHHFYLPVDLPFAMNKMLTRIAPRLIVITEVELWPNFIHRAWRQGIPSLVLNARMTDKSARSYAKVSALFTPMLAKLSHVCAQGQRDFDNYAKLGIDQTKLTLTNNLKFDQRFEATQLTESECPVRRTTRLTLVGGSTHDGEESALLDAYQAAHKAGQNLRLILVPRHPQRFDVVAKLIAERGLNFTRTSVLNKYDDTASIILADEMGKLGYLYQVSDIAFVGGSLANKGGHNALEAAARALPIIMGPHIHNNPVICEELIRSGGLTLIENKSSLIERVLYLSNNPENRQAQGQAGYVVINRNQGALAESLDIIQGLLDTH